MKVYYESLWNTYEGLQAQGPEAPVFREFCPWPEAMEIEYRQMAHEVFKRERSPRRQTKILCELGVMLLDKYPIDDPPVRVKWLERVAAASGVTMEYIEELHRLWDARHVDGLEAFHDLPMRFTPTPLSWRTVERYRRKYGGTMTPQRVEALFQAEANRGEVRWE